MDVATGGRSNAPASCGSRFGLQFFLFLDFFFLTAIAFGHNESSYAVFAPSYKSRQIRVGKPETVQRPGMVAVRKINAAGCGLSGIF
jgi:hypothetical protein